MGLRQTGHKNIANQRPDHTESRRSGLYGAQHNGKRFRPCRPGGQAAALPGGAVIVTQRGENMKSARVWLASFSIQPKLSIQQ